MSESTSTAVTVLREHETAPNHTHIWYDDRPGVDAGWVLRHEESPGQWVDVPMNADDPEANDADLIAEAWKYLCVGGGSVRAAILAEVDHDREATLSVIRERYNCAEADVDAEGDVWIADPQRGHWLSEDDLVSLVAYGREQHGWA